MLIYVSWRFTGTSLDSVFHRSHNLRERYPTLFPALTQSGVALTLATALHDAKRMLPQLVNAPLDSYDASSVSP